MNIYRYHSGQFGTNFLWCLVFNLCIAALIVVALEAFAFDKDPIGNALYNLVKVLHSDTVHAVGIGGMFIMGFQTLKGQLKWKVAFLVAAGLIILFKAPDIISMISASTAVVQNVVLYHDLLIYV